jgi:hypothetical protein
MPRWPRLPSDHAFDINTIRVLTAACADAWRDVHGRKSMALNKELRDSCVRLLIAVAERGQRNPAKLRAYAVTFLRAALSQERLGRPRSLKD